MNAIRGTVKNRQVHVEVPADWPEGCEVVIEPVAAPERGADEEGPETPEVIAARLALMDQLESGWLSPEDDAAWRAALREQKEYEKARFLEDAEKLRGMWE
jgi:hypothetical protein